MVSARALRDFVIVSWWMFAMWWFVLLSVHLATCGYNAAYALAYWELGQTAVGQALQFYHIGMTPEYNGMIATVHVVMASLHGLCALLMLGSSLWLQTLTFTPWGGSSIANDGLVSTESITKVKVSEQHLQRRLSNQTLGTVQVSMTKLSKRLTDRYGLLGVNGKHFHAFQTCRELIETGLQTAQAYRMSRHLPARRLNHFYVSALVLNCWSSPIIYALPFQQDDARKRFACLVCDLTIDLIACMGVTLIVVLKYALQYDPQTTDFGSNPWYDDVWVAQALNEFQMVVVASGSDLVSRTIFSLGIFVTTTNLKELLYKSGTSWCGRRVASSSMSSMLASASVKQMKAKITSKVSDSGVEVFETVMPQGLSTNSSPTINDKINETSIRHRIVRAMMNGVHLLFFIWGFLVLCLHIKASVQPRLLQCTLQVRPWAESTPSCFLLCLDCYRLGISGHIDEVDINWHEFDGSTVVIMVIKHCPSLDVPDVFTEFHQLISVKIYNTTIVEWRESAAITNSNHSDFISLMMVRVNMTDGVLPAGFLSADIPANLYDFEWCITNLRELPNDLDSKWFPGTLVIIEYSQLSTAPLVLLPIVWNYFSLNGNPISEIPYEFFEVEGLAQLGIGDTNIKELPSNVSHLSSTLKYIFMSDTNVSYFWNWADELVERTSAAGTAPAVYGGGSVYCSQVEAIANGSVNAFSTPFSNFYSQVLMDPAKVSPGGEIRAAVDCNPTISGFSGPLYPLEAEDMRNALDYSALYQS